VKCSLSGLSLFMSAQIYGASGEVHLIQQNMHTAATIFTFLAWVYYVRDCGRRNKLIDVVLPLYARCRFGARKMVLRYVKKCPLYYWYDMRRNFRESDVVA